MNSRQFLVFSFLGIIALAVFAISFNIYVDIYGLFRPARGRLLPICGEERVAKYLHSFRYLPDNFDGILLGSSVSDNLDTRAFAGHLVYNASINGGNIEDVKPIAENVFRRREFALTIICVHRSLTNDHAHRTDLMTQKQYWGALGSPQLVTAYLSRAALRLGLGSSNYDEFGALHFGSGSDTRAVQKHIDAAVAEIHMGTARVGNYHIDPVALADLQSVIELGRSHSRQTVIFYPPMPEALLEASSADFSRYRESVSSLLDSNVMVVDFNGPEYASFRANTANFIDAVHLSQPGAEFVISELRRAVDRRYTSQEAMLPSIPVTPSETDPK